MEAWKNGSMDGGHDDFKMAKKGFVFLIFTITLFFCSTCKKLGYECAKVKEFRPLYILFLCNLVCNRLSEFSNMRFLRWFRITLTNESYSGFMGLLKRLELLRWLGLLPRLLQGLGEGLCHPTADQNIFDFGLCLGLGPLTSPKNITLAGIFPEKSKVANSSESGTKQNVKNQHYRYSYSHLQPRLQLYLSFHLLI
jgi:hypothetical protein